MNPVFNEYAKAYDALYREKDYQAESDFIQQAFSRYGLESVRKVLDLGCGTGGHAIPLARRGYSVTGIDLSAQMIAQAGAKAREAGMGGQTEFQVANMQELNLEKSFDAAVCMFAVICYQTSNQALFCSLQAVRRHLNKGGLFLCDFWHGPAVLQDRPTERIKEIRVGEERIIRLAKPRYDFVNNVVTVCYHLLRINGERLIEETDEEHPMRYLFLPELEFFLTQADLRLIHACPACDLDGDVTAATWNVSVIAEAV